MNTHKVISLIGGDDLFINVQLLNQDREPYNLDSLDYIYWLLHNAKQEIVPIEHIIRHIDATAGTITVWLPNQETTRLAGGVYTQWLRVSCSATVSTLLTGPINVTADPWRAPVAVEATIMMASDASPLAAAVEQLAASHSVADVVVRLNRRERIERRPVIDRDEAAEVLPFMRRRHEARD